MNGNLVLSIWLQWGFSVPGNAPTDYREMNRGRDLRIMKQLKMGWRRACVNNKAGAKARNAHPDIISNRAKTSAAHTLEGEPMT